MKLNQGAILLTVFAIMGAVYSAPSVDENRYLPIFRFDGSQRDFCYPDFPSSQNDNKCVNSLNQNAPVFYEVMDRRFTPTGCGMVDNDHALVCLMMAMVMTGNTYQFTLIQVMDK